MINAAQAKSATLEKLTRAAKEFITNNVNKAVQEAIDVGKFSTIVHFGRVPSPEKTGALVVEFLQSQGFDVEHVYYDKPNGYDNYISIKWEDA